MPPSPLLSARIMRLTYFSETTSISDQNTRERMPSTLSWRERQVMPAEYLLHGVKRAGADVAEDDAERTERERAGFSVRRCP